MQPTVMPAGHESIEEYTKLGVESIAHSEEADEIRRKLLLPLQKPVPVLIYHSIRLLFSFHPPTRWILGL